MKHKSLNQSGIAHLAAALFVLVIVGIGSASYYVYSKNSHKVDNVSVQDDDPAVEEASANDTSVDDLTDTAQPPAADDQQKTQ